MTGLWRGVSFAGSPGRKRFSAGLLCGSANVREPGGRPGGGESFGSNGGTDSHTHARARERAPRCRIYMSKRVIVRAKNKKETFKKKREKKNFPLCVWRSFYRRYGPEYSEDNSGASCWPGDSSSYYYYTCRAGGRTVVTEKRENKSERKKFRRTPANPKNHHEITLVIYDF